MRITNTVLNFVDDTRVLLTPTPNGRFDVSADSTIKDFFQLTLGAQPKTVLEEFAGIQMGFLESPTEILPAKPPKCSSWSYYFFLEGKLVLNPLPFFSGSCLEPMVSSSCSTWELDT